MRLACGRMNSRAKRTTSVTECACSSKIAGYLRIGSPPAVLEAGAPLGKTAGVEVPARAKVDTTATKEQLVARLKETFVFCEQAFAKMDDSKLAEPVSMFGMNMTRAVALLITVGDWADHYSQESNYLRLNNILPPTAKQRM